MSIPVTCRCGRSFAAQPHLAGRQVACPACGQPLVVPSARVPTKTPAAAARPAPNRPAAPPGGLIVRCQCGQSFKAQPHLAGRQVACPACKRPLLIPAARPAQPAGASAPAGGDPLDALQDPLLWNQMLAVESRAPAAAQPLRPQRPKPKPRRRKWKPEQVRRMLSIFGGTAAALLVLVVAVIGFYAAKDYLPTVGSGGWREHTSQAGRFRASFPRHLGARPAKDSRTMYGITFNVEGEEYRGGEFAAVAYGDLPAHVEFDWAAVERSLRFAGVQNQRQVNLGSYRGLEYSQPYQDKIRLARLYVVDRRLYELVWMTDGSEELTSSEVQKFFDSFRVLGREDLSPSAVASAPAATPTPQPSPASGVGASGSGAQRPPLPDSYAAAREQFRTSLNQHGPAPQEYEPLQTPPGAQRITYESSGLVLTAFVDPPPADDPGEKRPAVLFLHGGFAFGDGDWEMADLYRQAGFVVMMPVLRGENGQAGHFTLYYDEVGDVLAAAEALSRLLYVDDSRVYVAGHSAGGSLAALAALASDRFAAAASFSGCLDQRLNADIAPFDTADDREFRVRSPLDFATSFQCPVRLYYGSQEDWAFTSTQETARRASAAGIDAQAIRVPGDHFSSVEPAIRQSIAFFQQQR